MVVRLVVALALLVGIVAIPAPVRATFSGANGLIVFDTQDAGGPSQIYSVRPDGSDLHQLTAAASGGGAFQSHWSADGRQIVYASDETGNAEIYVINADGGGKRQVTNDPAFSNSWPSFSPNGSTIVFSRCSNFLRTCDVALMGSDGSAIRSLVAGYWHHGQTVFSPDGSQIAFTSDQGGYDDLLWTVSPDGTRSQLVTRTPDGFDFTDHPDWSPDGRWITFTSNAGILAIRPNGSGRHVIVPPSVGAIYASYSPDGRRMVVDGPNGLSTMNPDGTGITPIPGAPSGATLSDWGVAS